MALFRKFFYRKPPDGLLEISERVYVFDCCFTTDVLEDDEYKAYLGGIVGQLQNHFPDASFMVFNFREGENQSQIAHVLSDYDMTVMDYPRQYEGCPLLTLEMIHHFLRSSESWLSLGQQNLILMHCERGGWPVLAFMLAALLIYRKQFTGEQKTLDIIYKQAPRELLQLISPLNPLPSQLRYLQYVSRRNVGSEWPPLDRALTLDCIILRFIPSMDEDGGCRPIFRIYGQNPFMAADRTPKVLFSTPKRSKLVRRFKQADCELVKIDINSHIQGDVVLECINLDADQEREEMVFRVMFNTAFIRSNILMLNRDEIDILWNAKDQFPKDFRTEILFSEMDSSSSFTSIDFPGIEEKDGLPMEAFAKVQEIFSNADWLEIDPKPDVAANVLQQIKASNILLENLESSFPSMTKTANIQLESGLENFEEKGELKASENNKLLISMAEERDVISSSKPSSDANSIQKKVEPQELHIALQRPAQSKIISQRPAHTSVSDANSIQKKVEPQVTALQQPAQSKIISQRAPHTSVSSPVSYGNSLQGSPVHISRYHSAPSALGITALLHDHKTSSREQMHPVTSSLTSVSSLPSAASIHKPMQVGHVSTSEPPSPPVLQSSIVAATSIIKTSIILPSPSLSPKTASNTTDSSSVQHPETGSLAGDRLSMARPSLPAFPSHSGSFPSPAVKSPYSTPPPPPPPPLFSEEFHPCLFKNSFSTPPPPPPPPSFPGSSPPSAVRRSISTPPSPPPPPAVASSIVASVSIKSSAVLPGPPTPPPPLCSGPILGSNSLSSAPPPPPPPISARKDLSSNNSPLVPPPPAPFAKGLSKTGGASSQSHSGFSNGNVPLVPGPPSMGSFGAKGRGISRTNPKNQVQPRKANLKPYHWLKLTRAMQGSLWAESQKPDEASKAPEFDMSELENLFSAAAPNSDNGAKGGKSNRRSSGPKIDKVQLLRRAYNCEIMLSKVKVPLSSLVSSVLALDDSALDVDQVDNLIKFCPTKEEMELLKGYNGDKENLGKCEQFFLELMKVPRVESKLRVFSFKMQFHSQVSDLRRHLNIVNSASEEIRNSVKLKRIMQNILSLGNALNHGTARGSAIGFRLDSLLKLTDTRARDNKTTLMHYLCKVLAEKLPELLDFPKDLVSLEASTKIQLKYLAEEMQAISKGLEKVVWELTASENDGPVSENFRQSLKDFLSFAEIEVRSLASLYSTVGRNADALAFYFGEDPARCTFEQVVSTLLNFVRMFIKAHDENLKQFELEKKKAQKDAQNEKLKMSSPRKESERLVHTPIK
ncbi:formin-like protein 18 isoform X2 [Tripterygium wilfordii]|uniref:formin-like protein 18 isoform X2 n=1 Tax=Tripterygium wilfordii TaxID=458696 RepID=UPI0018F85CC6|nr:formin-like protein 18 isoform X2 [Tripterygium wilfordii]